MRTSGLFAFGLVLALASCAEPDSAAPVAASVPSAPTPPPLQGPPSSGALLPLIGRYRLVVDLPASCPALPSAERSREYDVELRASPYSYLGVYIRGSADGTARSAGDLWGTPQALALKWNAFDLDCGGFVETLADGRAMMLCGVGTGALDAAGTVSLAFNGTVWTGANEGVLKQDCVLAAHPFTFTALR